MCYNEGVQCNGVQDTPLFRGLHLPSEKHAAFDIRTHAHVQLTHPAL